LFSLCFYPEDDFFLVLQLKIHKVDNNEINQVFGKFGRIRALVIGDSMVDTYLWGKAERISPEAPVPVVSVTQRESRLGGAANVALNLLALGATPLLISVVGDDEKGRKFKKLLGKSNLSTEGIFEDITRMTTVKSRIISQGKHIARVDEETTDFIGAEMEGKIVSCVKKTLETGRIDVILFVDYDKGVITPALFNQVNELAVKKGIPTAVDPKKRNFCVYSNVTLFKPNFTEFTEGIASPIKKGDLEALKTAAEKFKTNQNINVMLITLSELGIFASNGEKEQYFPAEIRYIADVSGAGDTVLSVAGLALAAGVSQKTMALMANIAGGLVCEKPGVMPVDRERLVREMRLQNF